MVQRRAVRVREDRSRVAYGWQPFSRLLQAPRLEDWGAVAVAPPRRPHSATVSNSGASGRGRTDPLHRGRGRRGRAVPARACGYGDQPVLSGWELGLIVEAGSR
jgi:hypothetical protein